MQHERPHNNIAYECFHYGQTLAVLPLPENRSSIVITVATDKSGEILEWSEEQFNSVIQMRFKNRLGRMELIGQRYPYPLVAVHADKLATTRFALIGDAAVGMHPVTAHGFNLGLRGQDTLATVIEAAVARARDIGSSNVLEQYESKHRRVSLPLYHGTNGIVRLYTDDRPIHRLMRKAILRFANNFGPVKTAIVHQLTEIRN
jgi:ubiquinone biosynthesis UbiH/UbiF/VisC/COQ6 family hydroxylase